MSFLFGNSAKTQVTPYTSLFPLSQKYKARAVVGAGLDLFPELINRGETEADRNVFNASRADTIQQYQDATNNATQMLNRAGAANSTGGLHTFGKLSEALLGTLAQQDVARERELMQRRLQAALSGGQFISGVSNAGRVTQKPADSGFLGAMAPVAGLAAGAALTGGLGALFAPAAAGASAGEIGLAGSGAFTGLA